MCILAYSVVILLTNSVPLLEISSFGTPYLRVISCKCPRMVRASADSMGKASGHLVRYFTNVRMYLFLLGVTGRGPMTSIPHLCKMSDGGGIGCKGVR